MSTHPGNGVPRRGVTHYVSVVGFIRRAGCERARSLIIMYRGRGPRLLAASLLFLLSCSAFTRPGLRLLESRSLDGERHFGVSLCPSPFSGGGVLGWLSSGWSFFDIFKITSSVSKKRDRAD